MTTNLPFLRWLVAHPVVRAGETTTAFLIEHPPLSAPPSLRAPAAALTPWRLNLPSPPAAPPPDVDDEAHRASAAEGESAITAPMPGTVIRVEVDAGRRGPRAPAARRARGDEDGDPGAARRSTGR